MDTPDRLILCDDDTEIRELLSAALQKEGFDVVTTETPEALRKALQDNPFDLIIMDLMMPGEDGITATRTLRLTSQIPLIMLTAKGEDIDRIIGLEIGADDYVAKPFNTRELIARIRAVLRRHRTNSADDQNKAPSHGPYHFEGWHLDSAKRTLYDGDGEQVDLTSGEFDLLLVFVCSPGRVLSRDYLLERTKGRLLHAFDRSVDIQVSRLRNKIEIDPKHPDLIKTIRNSGYMLTAQVKEGENTP